MPSVASAGTWHDRVRQSASGALRASGSHERVPGEVVVRYRASADGLDKSSLRSEVDTQDVEKLATPSTEVLSVPVGSVDDAIATYQASPDVLFAEPNYFYEAAATANDPRFSQIWGLNNTGQSVLGVNGTPDADIDATEAWDKETGSAATVVAVLDSGVAYDHPDLAGNIWTNSGETGSGKDTNNADDDSNGFRDDSHGWDFVDDDNAPRDLLGHGTHVAGTIGAVGNNSYGTTGVSWDVSIMPLRVLDAEGSGRTSDVASAISYAAAKGADVINLSLGGPDFSNSVSSAISSSSGVLIVAAAGNENVNNDLTPSYPCSYPAANVVCVAATDINDNLASYSNYGALNVDLAAPGSRVVSTVPAFGRPLRESFESDIAATWTAGGTGMAWSRGLDAFGYFATDSVTGNYLPNSDSWLKTASATSLVGQQDCRLTYSFKLNTETGHDFFKVEASSDGTSWSQVSSWSGSSGNQWTSSDDDLHDFDGGPIYVRFRLTSNSSVENDGVSIDQVEIKCLTSTYTGNEFSYFSGTSMATPFVAGAAALLVSLVPDAPVASLRAALLGGVDASTGMVGKTVTGGRLNLNSSVALLAPDAAPASPPASTTTPAQTVTTPTPTPTPVVSESPTPAPVPSVVPTPPMVLDYERTVSLSLSHHIRAIGEVAASGESAECVSGVVVSIKRNGRVVKQVKTDPYGHFATSLRDRGGSYRAVIRVSEFAGAVCGAARSSSVRH